MNRCPDCDTPLRGDVCEHCVVDLDARRAAKYAAEQQENSARPASLGDAKAGLEAARAALRRTMKEKA